MISCTEFIPSYSELFSFLDENFGGHALAAGFTVKEENIPALTAALRAGVG